MLLFGAKDLKELVYQWNAKFPIDRWYRDKYKIRFNSKEHKECSFIDMYCEYIEYIYLEYIPQLKKRNKSNQEEDDFFKTDEYIKGNGDIFKEISFSEKDFDNMFDELDIDNM